MHNITDADVQKRDHGTYDLLINLLVFYIFYSPKITRQSNSSTNTI